MDSATLLSLSKAIGINGILIIMIKMFIKQNEKKIDKIESKIKGLENELDNRISNVDRSISSVHNKILDQTELIIKTHSKVDQTKLDLCNKQDKLNTNQEYILRDFVQATDRIENNHGKIKVIEEDVRSFGKIIVKNSGSD